MTTTTPLCGADGQQCEYEDPLTRLALLLEIAREPEWLREAAAARAGMRGPAAPRD
jgi:hypothetical protein